MLSKPEIPPEDDEETAVEVFCNILDGYSIDYTLEIGDENECDCLGEPTTSEKMVKL